MSEFTMPSLGADMDAGTLVEWLVHEGDTVHRGDLMAVVDTDKSAIEVEAFADGVVEAFLVEPGTRVAVGTPLARLAPLGSAAPATPAPATAPAPAPFSAPVEGEPSAVIPAPRSPLEETPPTRLGSPPLRHHAAELGVDLTQVSGTGPHGEITRTDVDRAAAAARAGTTVTAAPATTPPGAPAPLTTERPSAPAPDSAESAPPRQVSPYARRLAHELGVDLAEVTGSGRDGVVRAGHVRAAAAQAALTAPQTAAPAAPRTPAPGAPEPDVAPGAKPPSGATARTSSRATIAALMSRAKREIPHYYVAETVDLSALTTWLRRTNRDRPVSERIVPAAALIKATALAAREHPELNGFWLDDAFVPADDVHLGVAVHVRGGALVAPAIHHTADLALPQVMAALRDLVSRARAGRLRRTELADPTLTVTDLGDQGVEEVIGVIYPPQVALVGIGRIVERPWAVDGMIGVRPTVRLTLSGDHRATDGATGARFLATLEQHLQHPEEL